MTAKSCKIKAGGARFVRFYPSDWRSGCLAMTLEQQGLYVAICAFQWETGRRLELNDTNAAHALGLNPKNYRKVRDQLLEMGKIQRHEDGYSNARAESELGAALGAGAASRRQAETPDMGAARDVHSEHQDGRNQASEWRAGENAITDQSPVNYGSIDDQSTILVQKNESNQGLSIEPIAYSQKPREEPRESDADRKAREAYELGLKIKGGKVAKSARAIQVAQGELDGARGIELRDGKLTVTGEARFELSREFPTVNLEAVANKACPELHRTQRPTYGTAMAVMRKWAQFELDHAKRTQASSRGEIVNFRVTGHRYAKPREEVANA